MVLTRYLTLSGLCGRRLA